MFLVKSRNMSQIAKVSYNQMKFAVKKLRDYISPYMNLSVMCIN